MFLTAGMPGYMPEYFNFIDWRTIITLLALIMTANGIKDSGFLEKIAGRILIHIRNERSLAYFLVFLSLILSTFLTNDITLFITVPLTLCMQSILKKDLVKIVIFEALGVNAGSSLTPIGNPQNIFLWNKWGISFSGFIFQLAPAVILMAAVLAVFIYFGFKAGPLQTDGDAVKPAVNNGLGLMSFSIMVLFLVCLQLKSEIYAIPVIVLVYLIFQRKVLVELDWLLILTFVLMFIDFSMISRIPLIESALAGFDFSKSTHVFILSALVSQFMSNVPAAIFMAKFTSNWKAITLGVDIAGNGIIIGSLANIIAIRLLKSKDKRVWLDFHKYSVPYFLVTGIIVWFFLR
jgi:Na+/H+ antiporter NhaD/arsenite permease-like protein